MQELCTHINDKYIDDILTKWVDHIQLLKQVYTRRQSLRAHMWDYLYKKLCQFYGVHSQIKQEEDRCATTLELKVVALLKQKHEQDEHKQKEREKAAKPIAKCQMMRKNKPAHVHCYACANYDPRHPSRLCSFNCSS
ncbi:hypothetical protein GGH94_005938 [Coemansia aciculifera]|uniref:Uncharacterized protein n=1 Tax=Coemansia aciculifera TaxID=417176 RepID=A0A9W8IF49_9FUNG|nr:hypothetical protein GGH94_005938 [Coemansia aciculifera]